MRGFNFYNVCLAPIQHKLYHRMKDVKNNTVMSTMSRGAGKTFLLQKFIVDNFLNSFIGVLSPTERQTRMILEPIKVFMNSVSHGYRVEDDGISYVFNNSESGIGRSRYCVDRFKLSLIHQYDIVLVDEACDIPEQILVEIDKYAKRKIMLSSGTYTSNTFGKMCLDNVESYYCVPYWMLPKDFIYYGNIEEAFKTLSYDEFMMEYCAAILPDKGE